MAEMGGYDGTIVAAAIHHRPVGAAPRFSAEIRDRLARGDTSRSLSEGISMSAPQQYTGDKKRAAALLGISRTTLYSALRAYDITTTSVSRS